MKSRPPEVSHPAEAAAPLEHDPLAPGGEGWSGAEPGRLRYVPGLDGLRAIAVMAVLLYHANLAGTVLGLDLTFAGGFLGVEVFFVVSGYLITSLLLSEWRRDDRVKLGNFWLRRARRLLPALFLLLGTVMVVALLFYRDEVASLRSDVLSAVFYVTNWFFIIGEESYFEAIGRPSLVQHLWSLAVEEQFYLFWPLLFTFFMKRIGPKRLGWLVLGGAALSAFAMWALLPAADPSDPSKVLDPSRSFMGTDTRASALLIGCALAFVWPQWRLSRRIRPGAVLMLDVIGVLGVLGLCWLFVSVGEYDTVLYPFGFLACSILTAGAIAVVVHPAAHIGPALGNRLLRWIGVRSYGIYLWHWPIFMITRPGIDVQFDGIVLFGFRFGLTFAVAALSYHYVEQPVREGALGRAWRDYRSSTGLDRQRRQFQVLGGAAAVLALVAVITVGAINAEEQDYNYLLNVASGEELGPPTTVNLEEFFAGDAGAASNTLPVATPTGTSLPPPETTSTAVTPAEVPPPTTALTIPFDQRKIVFLGDSVMLGAKNAQAMSTQFPSSPVDAAQNRQVVDGLAVLNHWASAGWLVGVDTVVVHLGTNGTFTDAQFDQIMSVLAPVKHVVFVNDKVPQRSWEATNNQVIAAGVARYPDKAVLIDWNAAAKPHPEFFYNDGTHLNSAGAAFYAQLIRESL